MSVLKKMLRRLLICVPFCRVIIETRGSQTPVRFIHILTQKVIGFNRDVYWPVHYTSTVSNWRNIYAGIDVSPGYSPGCYIQGIGKVYIGDYTQIAPNVGIISANHSVYDSRAHDKNDEVRIGKYGWIGMNSVILPGVMLGDFTIVGAGSVVTKSFCDGYCVIGGNPAKLIRKLEYQNCIRYRNIYEYNGYVKSEKFDEYRRSKLNI